jgi:REP element-mobilizing transposase RayT
MTRARKEQVSLETTTYYHCISRCVRRAFLCGEDHLTGKNYDYRKAWVIERLRELDQVFCIDLCAYAVMSNHTHLVVRYNPQQAESLDEESLIKRWTRLYKCPVLIQRYLKGECKTQAEQDKVQEILEEWRKRILNLSWYMGALNEHLARRANEEDQCTGRFWEGRFKSQALLDEAAVLTCMSYVDLNPIRAKMADTPEESDYTSIQQRICQWHKTQQAKELLSTNIAPTPKLMPLVKQHRDNHQHSIGFTLNDYLELVDWAGREVREDKRGAIDTSEPPILKRLGIDADAFVQHMKGGYKEEYPRVMGRLDNIRQACAEIGKRFIRGMHQSRLLYSP